MEVGNEIDDEVVHMMTMKLNYPLVRLILLLLNGLD